MAKIRISSKRKKSSGNTLRKTYRLKKGVMLPKHDPLKTLTNEKIVAQAFWECLRDNDLKGAAEIIAMHLNALNKSRLAQEETSPVQRSITAFETDPTLKTVAKLIHCCL